jgi:hypothetical protein
MSALLNMVAKPPMVAPEPATALPECLTTLPQWVAWTFECRGGKLTKCPRTPAGALAKSDTPSTWSTFADVMAAADQRPDMGVGFVFSPDDPFVGLDLDDCLTPDGTLKAWAVPIMERFSDTYSEVSPSGHGIKIWVRGTLTGLTDGTGTRRPYGDGGIEVYQRGRYFTVTGRRYATSPLNVSEHQGDVEWLWRLIGAPLATSAATRAIPVAFPEQPMPEPEPAREFTRDEQVTLRLKLEAARTNVPKFDDLWLGGACGYYAAGKPDPSRADLAFCNFVAYHLGMDAAGVDQAFRMSERMRPKWDEKHFSDGRTYGQATIQKALQWAAQERQRSVTGTVATMPTVSATGGTIAELNAMPVFVDVGLAWEKFEMSGDLIFGYAAGQRVKWENTAELLSFAKSQAIILKYMRTLIPSPSRARIKAIWEPAAGMMVRLATVINSGDEMQVEIADLAPMCFRRAGAPVARSDADVFRFMLMVRDWRRDPYTADGIESGSAPAPFVFVYDGSVFLNAHKLRLWASLPRVTATMIRKGEMTRELGSLGFKYERGFERVYEGKRVTMDLWRGPLTVLGDSLEESDIPGAEAQR